MTISKDKWMKKKDTPQISSKLFSISVDYRRARDSHSTASSLKRWRIWEYHGTKAGKPRTCVCKQTFQDLHHLLASKSGHTLAGVGYRAHRAMAVRLQKQPMPQPAGRDCHWGSGTKIWSELGYSLLSDHCFYSVGKQMRALWIQHRTKPQESAQSLWGHMPWFLLSSPLPTS